MKDNIVSISRAYSLKKVSYNMKSGMRAEVTCYSVRVSEVLNETIKLPLGTSSRIKTLKDVGDAEILWPSNQTILDQKVTQQNLGEHTLDVTSKATSNRSKSEITTTAAVHPGRRCYLFDELSMANVLVRGRAFLLAGKQKLHGKDGGRLIAIKS